MSKVTREAILAFKLPTVDVEVEGIGEFTVRALTAREALTFGLAGGGNEVSVAKEMPTVLVKCLLGEDGERLFKDAETVALMDALPANAMVILMDAIMDVSGLTDDEDEEAGEKAPFEEAPRPSSTE